MSAKNYPLRQTSLSMTSEESKLRGGEWAEDQVGDVADDGLVAVARVGGELFPVGMVAEGVPASVVLVEAGEAEHVGEAGHAGADERVAEKDGMKAGGLEAGE